MLVLTKIRTKGELKMNLPEEILEIAKSAKDRDALKVILEDNHIEISDPEINELCWLLDIPHGYNCPCCMGRFMAIRYMGNKKTPKPKWTE